MNNAYFAVLKMVWMAIVFVLCAILYVAALIIDPAVAACGEWWACAKVWYREGRREARLCWRHLQRLWLDRNRA